MTASVHLYHRMGIVLAWAGTLLVGQGMYEQHLDQVEARFRLFRRDDGSLHFVREFWCDALLEVFQDLGVAARMRTEVLEDGGLAMTVVGLFVRGVPIPVAPAAVRFETRPDGQGGLLVSGVLDLQPGSALSRLWFRRVMGLPERLGEIRYYAVPAVALEASGKA
jgi:hypothetical protein